MVENVLILVIRNFSRLQWESLPLTNECPPGVLMDLDLISFANQYRQTRISSVLDFLTRCRLLVTYIDRGPKVRDPETLGQDVLTEEFIGSNRASATKTVPSQ
jgi:hypothetical protein